MTGIVNVSGAKSGAVGTTSGAVDLSTATFPSGHVLQTVGARDNTTRTLANAGSTALEGVTQAITSSVADSNFYITGTMCMRSMNGHWAVGLFSGGLSLPGNLIHTPSHRDSSGQQGWYGWYILGRNATDTTTNPYALPSVAYFYDPGSAASGTVYDFKIGVMSYNTHGPTITNCNNTVNGFSSITIQEIQP